MSSDRGAAQSASAVGLSLALILTASLSFAAPPRADCEPALGSTRDLPLIASKLEALPRVRPFVTRLWMDPDVPSHLKRILKVALLDEDVKVFEYTDDIRAENQSTWNAFYVYPIQNHRSISTAEMMRLPRGQSARLAARLKRWVPGLNRPVARIDYGISQPVAELGPAVFVQNRPVTATENDFCALVHELAHIRFFRFIERHLDQLARVLPTQFLYRRDDGSFFFDFDFLEYMSELYAAQVEYALHRATHGRYFHDVYRRFRELHQHESDHDEAREPIARNILEAYDIQNPEVRALVPYSLAQILLGAPFKAKPLRTSNVDLLFEALRFDLLP